MGGACTPQPSCGSPRLLSPPQAVSASSPGAGTTDPDPASSLQVSPSLKGFLDRLLVRDPAQRATAAELLKHPFLAKAGPPASIVPLMRQHRNR